MTGARGWTRHQISLHTYLVANGRFVVGGPPPPRPLASSHLRRGSMASVQAGRDVQGGLPGFCFDGP